MTTTKFSKISKFPKHELKNFLTCEDYQNLKKNAKIMYYLEIIDNIALLFDHYDLIQETPEYCFSPALDFLDPYGEKQYSGVS